MSIYEEFGVEPVINASGAVTRLGGAPMPKAVVNPEELRRFASELKRFNGELKEGITGLHHRFVKLGDTWQDQEHAKFAEIFEQMFRTLTKFADAADHHIPFLLRKAERIQAYLDQR